MNFLGCLKNHWQKQILYKSKSMTELLGEVHSATYCVVKACREKKYNKISRSKPKINQNEQRGGRDGKRVRIGKREDEKK